MECIQEIEIEWQGERIIAGASAPERIPAIPKYNPERFSQQVKELMDRFADSHRPGQSIMTNIKLRSLVQTLEDGARNVQAPLQRLEHAWHMPMAYLIIPIFALANAGIPLDFTTLGQTMTHPVVMGVSLGLVLAKFIGITGASWLVLKLGVAVLPKDTRFTQIAGVSLLAGIGFTPLRALCRSGRRAVTISGVVHQWSLAQPFPPSTSQSPNTAPTPGTAGHRQISRRWTPYHRPGCVASRRWLSPGTLIAICRPDGQSLFDLQTPL